MKNLMVVMTMAAVLGVCGVVTAEVAQAPETAAVPEVDDTYTIDTVSGEVTGITSRSISILYNRDYDTGTEYEIMIPVDDKALLKHKKTLKEIKPGDLVSVEYEKPGAKSQHRSRARVVNFIQSGVAGLTTSTLPENTTSEAGSTE